MKFVEEVVVEEFLPTVRSMLAEELRDRGFTQREVAEALGISQSAVSKYAHGEVSRTEAILSDDRVRATVQEVAEGLASGETSRVAALIELEVLIRELERGDLLADRHEAAMPELAETEYDFAVHDPDSEARDRERTLSSVRRGLRGVRNTSGFATLIPNVGSNLVEAVPDAATVEDVAAVPGRIFDVKGQAKVPADPEYGVSAHVAGVLLAARDAGLDVRAALNLAYSPATVDALADAGYPVAEFDAEGGSEAAAAALSRVVGDTGKGDDGVDTDETDGVRRDADGAGGVERDAVVAYQSGAQGIEPIVYVLGPDAPTVVRVAREAL
ncbi:thiamine-phosphate synthase family protein [Halobaculum sp. MBLA0147]|uniref:thiamine-phosphate synthase family protein n=1 Tax=Halobaculum sp. MBLA0147 TaxID=3079934 RepID=UPI00352651D5